MQAACPRLQRRNSHVPEYRAVEATKAGYRCVRTGIVRTDIDTNATTVTDQAGKQRRSVTNALGQLVRVDEPDATSGQLGSVTAPNQPTSYVYDTLNNLTTVTQNGTNSAQCGGTVSTCAQTRSFVYDSLSRLKSATNPESGTINYVYDNNGNLTSKTDARGVKTDYIYDALNRVTNRNYSTPNGTPGVGVLANYQPSPNVTYSYDGANVAGGIANSKGKLTKVSSSVSTTEYTSFDILGRVTRSKQTTDGVEYGGGTDPTKWMTYTYNLSGALIEQQYPSGRVARNTLDTDGSLQQVQSRRANDTFRNYANAFTYNAAGVVSAMRLGNGKWESTQFNSRLQPTQIALGGSAGNTNLLKLDYTYNTPNVADNNGNVLSQTITVPTVGASQGFTATQNYTYDSLNRLKSAVENVTPNGGSAAQSWKQTYAFDRYGNRRFDVANTTSIPAGCAEAVCNPQIDPATNKLVGYQFDNAGNTKVDANGQNFIYDSENKQTAVSNQQSAVIGQYSYDGDGKRVKKVVPATGETTMFVYDAAGKTVAEYSTVVEPTSTAKISYLTNDHLGSPRITTDAVGQVISRRDFRPYGEEITRANYGSDSVRHKFTGYEKDNESNLNFAQTRYQNSSLGRFVTPDMPFIDQTQGDSQSWNLYIYVRNNPLKFIDPFGLWHADKDGNVLGDYDGECSDEIGGCWDEKSGKWEFGGDKTPVQSDPSENDIVSGFIDNPMDVFRKTQTTDRPQTLGRSPLDFSPREFQNPLTIPNVPQTKRQRFIDRCCRDRADERVANVESSYGTGVGRAMRDACIGGGAIGATGGGILGSLLDDPGTASQIARIGVRPAILRFSEVHATKTGFATAAAKVDKKRTRRSDEFFLH